jgi:glutamyl-tRNA(Gln) amidotransferase, subunit D
MLEGYSGKIRDYLVSKNIDVGDIIEVSTPYGIYKGRLMPRYEIYESDYITLKLPNGYNIGIKFDEKVSVNLVQKKEEEQKIQVKAVQEKNGKTVLSYIATGGTIMSRIDYKTGAVKPSFNVEDLADVVPDAISHSTTRMIELMKILSEDITCEHWKKISHAVYEEIKNGSKGIIITHGTDTMGYTSAALSFSLINLPHPVLLVGAQRSLDRPSSDAALNLYSAHHFALKSEYSGVFVVMHGTTSDEFCVVHRGTRVRKMHTSRRDAFKTINSRIVAKILKGNIVYEDTEGLLKRDDSREIKLMNNFENKVFLLKTFASMPQEASDIITYLVDKGYRGILIEGTGLGHVPHSIIDAIKYATDKGVIVAIASQCLYGRINMHVYETGRLLIKSGAIGCEDMLPETAFVKLMWVLGNYKDMEEAKRMFLTNIAGEISYRLEYLE